MIRAILAGRKTQTRRLLKPQPKCIGTSNLDRFEFGCLDTGWWYPTSKSGKVGIFEPHRYKCPFGVVEDRLYVKETWVSLWFSTDYETGYADDWGNVTPTPRSKEEAKAKRGWPLMYRADEKVDVPLEDRGFKWLSPLFMPRWASRITLEITDIRVERLQDITPEDAHAEGAQWKDFGRTPYNIQLPGWSMEDPHPDHYGYCLNTAPIAFGNYINKIHGGKNWHLKPTNIWDENPWVWVITFKVIE